MENKSSFGNASKLCEPLTRSAWHLGLLLAWGVWWGGLCFYAVVVVPIGTEVIGSVEQGFITQRVTFWHNLITALFLLGLLIEAFRRRSRALWAAGCALTIIEIALLVWHARLTGFMDFQHQTVPGHFYSEHAVYLWITAAEWILGIVLPVWLFQSKPQPSGALNDQS